MSQFDFFFVLLCVFVAVILCHKDTKIRLNIFKMRHYPQNGQLKIYKAQRHCFAGGGEFHKITSC